MKKQYVLLASLFVAAISLVIAGCFKEDLPTPEAAGEELAMGDLEVSPDLKAGDVIEGQYIVVFKKDVFPQESMRSLATLDARKERVAQTTQQVLAELKMDKAARVTRTYGMAVLGFAAEMDEAAAERLAADPRVAYVEQDQVASIVGGPPGGGGGGGGGNPPSQSTPWGITRVNGVASYSGNGRAWVIDSGVDLNHPDLNVNSGASTCWLSNCNAGADDQNGHGTHVAGTIAALNNSEGVIGVAPGAEVIAVRVLDRRGSGSYSGVLAGIDHVTANGANGDVANLSLGGGVSTAIDDAVIALGASGVKVAIAAGNESTNANNSSPARANGNNLYTISAMNSSDSWASFSNYGNPPVDYCAPGVSVLSCYKDGGYATLSGTSMATPHVAGILLLGNIQTDGTVSGDPDGNPDPIAVH